MLPRGRKHARRRPTALPQTRRAAPSARTLRRSSKLGGRSAAPAQKPRETPLCPQAQRSKLRSHRNPRFLWQRRRAHSEREKRAVPKPPHAGGNTAVLHHVQPSATSASALSPHARPYSHTAILPQTQPFVQPARPQVQSRCACHRTDGKTAATLASGTCTATKRLLGFRSLAEARHRSRAQPARQPALHAGAAHEPPPAKGNAFPFETPANTQRHGKHVIPKPPLCAGEIAANAPMQCTAVGRAHARRLVEHSRAQASHKRPPMENAKPMRFSRTDGKTDAAQAPGVPPETRPRGAPPPPPRPSDARAAHCTPQRHIPQRRKKRDPLTGRSLF